MKQRARDFVDYATSRVGTLHDMRFGDPVNERLCRHLGTHLVKRAEEYFLPKIPSDDIYAAMNGVMRDVKIFDVEGLNA